MNLILYILVDKKPSKISFMTTLDRELFPIKMPRNRFGNEIAPLRGAPHRGPGCYENEEVSVNKLIIDTPEACFVYKRLMMFLTLLHSSVSTKIF